jgi:flagellar hook protein FlgE
MLDLINLGTMGMQGFSKGLQVIGNNTANLNTPGFKGSTIQFVDVLLQSRGGQGNADMPGQSLAGLGLSTMGSTLNLSQGSIQSTGNSMDAAINGIGMFTLVDPDGQLHYTRAGQFSVDAGGTLVSQSNNFKLVGLTNGAQGPISTLGKQSIAAAATGTISFRGNIAPTDTTTTSTQFTIYDADGVAHQLTLRFAKSTSTDPTNPATPTTGTTWTCNIQENSLDLIPPATATLNFSVAGIGGNTVQSVFCTLQGSKSMNLMLDFSGLTSMTAYGQSSVTMQSQDGSASGSLTNMSIDSSGYVVYTYSNGKTDKGSRLLLSRYDAGDHVTEIGLNEFVVEGKKVWATGVAGEDGFGSIVGGSVEASNVDLTQQMGQMIVMQRGYQASSQIVTAANEMMQQLLQMHSSK